jgi:hypothetical protein
MGGTRPVRVNVEIAPVPFPTMLRICLFFRGGGCSRRWHTTCRYLSMHHTHSLLASLALLLAAPMGCSERAEEPDGSEQEIIGGVEDGSLAASVVQLFVRSPGQLPIPCTGVVVSPRTVVTAEDCYRNFGTETVVMLGPRTRMSELTGTPPKATATPWVEWVDAYRGRQSVRTTLMFVTFNEPIPGAKPVPVGAEPAKGAPVVFHGYGCAGEGKAYGTLRSKRHAWGSWKGFWNYFFAPGFSCGSSDLGAGVFDARGRLVGIATGEDEVTGFDLASLYPILQHVAAGP